MITAILHTLCGCTGEKEISFASKILQVPIPRSYYARDDDYGLGDPSRTPAGIRRFELREYQFPTDHLKGRAYYEECR